MLEAHARLKAGIERLKRLHEESVMQNVKHIMKQELVVKLHHEMRIMHEENLETREKLDKLTEETDGALAEAHAALMGALDLTSKPSSGLSKL